MVVAVSYLSVIHQAPISNNECLYSPTPLLPYSPILFPYFVR